MDTNQIVEGLTNVLIILACVTVHEWAHAFVADKLGDPTPADQGRVTLNPASHIDPIGTLALPLMMALMGGGLFGWGKPVLTQPSNYKIGPRVGDILVSLAGPFSNLLMGIAAGALAGYFQSRGFDERAVNLALQFALINALLAGLNLLPIPPLDGFHVLRRIIKMKDELYYKISRVGFVIVLLFFMFPPLMKVVHFAWSLAYLPMQVAFLALGGKG